MQSFETNLSVIREETESSVLEVRVVAPTPTPQTE